MINQPMQVSLVPMLHLNQVLVQRPAGPPRIQILVERAWNGTRLSQGTWALAPAGFQAYAYQDMDPFWDDGLTNIIIIIRYPKGRPHDGFKRRAINLAEDIGAALVRARLYSRS